MRYTPSALPPRLNEVFDWLVTAGVREAILYGGALRDADKSRPISDYDLLVGERRQFQSLVDEERVIARLQEVGDCTQLRSFPENGRYILAWPDGLEVDICLNRSGVSAEEKPMFSDVGLSSIAMDLFLGSVHVTKNYLKDHVRQNISLLSGWNGLPVPYAEKIQKKYPEYTVVCPLSGCIVSPALSPV